MQGGRTAVGVLGHAILAQSIINIFKHSIYIEKKHHEKVSSTSFITPFVRKVHLTSEVGPSRLPSKFLIVWLVLMQRYHPRHSSASWHCTVKRNVWALYGCSHLCRSTVTYLIPGWVWCQRNLYLSMVRLVNVVIVKHWEKQGMGVFVLQNK